MAFEAAPITGDVTEPETEEGILDVVARALLPSVGGQRIAAFDVAQILEPGQFGRQAGCCCLGLLRNLVVLSRTVRDRPQDRQVSARVANALAFAQQVTRLVVPGRVLGQDPAGNDFLERAGTSPYLVLRRASEDGPAAQQASGAPSSAKPAVSR